MKRPVPPPASLVQTVVADERWIREWVDFGLRELAVYLARHLAFARYCDRTRPDKEEP